MGGHHLHTCGQYLHPDQRYKSNNQNHHMGAGHHLHTLLGKVGSGQLGPRAKLSGAQFALNPCTLVVTIFILINVQHEIAPSKILASTHCTAQCTVHRPLSGQKLPNSAKSEAV